MSVTYQRALLAIAVLFAAWSWAEPAAARLLIGREEALASIFGEDSVVETATLYLTTEEMEEIRQTARAPFDRKRITFYRITVGDSLAGVAIVDKHFVRTLSETVLIALDATGGVLAVEILAWNEPDDYRPPGRWLDLAREQDAIDVMRPGEGMPRLAGSTLSARAMTAAIRRSLAIGKMVLPTKE